MRYTKYVCAEGTEFLPGYPGVVALGCFLPELLLVKVYSLLYANGSYEFCHLQLSDLVVVIIASHYGHCALEIELLGY
jgi:hypothetical protein